MFRFHDEEAHETEMGIVPDDGAAPDDGTLAFNGKETFPVG